MINECLASPTHAGLMNAIYAGLGYKGWHAHTEVRLPNGKIADLYAIDRTGATHIIEVKLLETEWHADQTIEKYYGWAHYLWLAAHVSTRPGEPDGKYWISAGRGRKSIGIISFDAEGIHFVKEPLAVTIDAAKLRLMSGALKEHEDRNLRRFEHLRANLMQT